VEEFPAVVGKYALHSNFRVDLCRSPSSCVEQVVEFRVASTDEVEWQEPAGDTVVVAVMVVYIRCAEVVYIVYST
jgi:hypothetical protein